MLSEKAEVAEALASAESTTMNMYVCYFSSPSCAPCRTIKPTIEELKEDYAHVPWKSINTSVDQAEMKQLGVTSIPAMVIVKDGKEVGRHTGTTLIGYYNLLRRNCPNPLTV
jgi:thioredoxin 1